MQWIRVWRQAGVVTALLLLAACNMQGLQKPASVPLRVSLVSFNDFHGNLLPSGQTVPVRGEDGSVRKVPAGGAAYLATLISTLRAENPERTLLVAAGDLIGASPPVSGLFHDEPTIEAMNELGLSVSSVGNHEFDKGRDELLRMQRGGCRASYADGKRGIVGVDTCMNSGRFDGARFQYLAANVIDLRNGQPLLPPYAVREVGGVKIGFIGVTLKETPSVVTPKGVEGLRFDDEVQTINRWVPALKREGAAFVVALLHQGGETRAVAINDVSCPGFSGEALRIADALDPAVAVVITGHTHQEYVCHRPDGRLLTQAGHYGRLATKIDLDVDPANGRVLARSARNHVAANDPRFRDAAMDERVQRHAQVATEHGRVVVARIAAPLMRQPGAAGESALGNVIADAYLAGAGDSGFGARAAQIGLVNPGGIRSDLTGPEVNSGHLYQVHPFGNTLITLELTGAQLHRLLEQQWERPQPPGGRVLAVSAGFSYKWDAGRPEGAAPGRGERVAPGSMRLNGAPIEPAAIYRVVVNSFLASGGDNFTVFAQARQVQESELDLDALTAYFRARQVVEVPALDRIGRVN